MKPKPCIVANRSLASTATSMHCVGAPGAERHSLVVPDPLTPSKLYLAPPGRFAPAAAPTKLAIVCWVSGVPAEGGGEGGLEMSDSQHAVQARGHGGHAFSGGGASAPQAQQDAGRTWRDTCLPYASREGYGTASGGGGTQRPLARSIVAKSVVAGNVGGDDLAERTRGRAGTCTTWGSGSAQRQCCKGMTPTLFLIHNPSAFIRLSSLGCNTRFADPPLLRGGRMF